ncbi:HTH domain-containing protein [Candidatus Woesearchaeota archaeon]|nr:HTH domain-containing protein [Candidatus Woesearchaeota archaeon]
MVDKTKELETELNQYFQEVGRMQGISSEYMKIFSAVYLEPDEITMEELCEKTGYSPASICNKIKQLETTGMIIKKTKPGSKKIYLTMDRDMIAIIKKNIILKQEHILRLAHAKIPEIIKRYESKMKTEKEKKKIGVLKDYYQQVQEAEKIFPQILELLNKASENRG